MRRGLGIGFALLVLAGALGVAWQLLRAGIEVEVYRARLADLARDFDQLRVQYDEAVRRTAVTELIVEDGRLDVVVRSDLGELRRIETPFDPAGEIYVDFVVMHGRLWIRRLFDASTAPDAGLVIDPRWVHVDWSADASAHGKATYRALGEGRWVVTVTGDGSLGLARSDTPTSPELASAPEVRDYEPVGDAVDARLGDLEAAEILDVLLRRTTRD